MGKYRDGGKYGVPAHDVYLIRQEIVSQTPDCALKHMIHHFQVYNVISITYTTLNRPDQITS